MSAQYKDWDEFEASLTIVGDEAYLPGERPPRRLSQKPKSVYNREWMARRRQDPEYRLRELRRAAERRASSNIRRMTDAELDRHIEEAASSLHAALGERRRRAA